MFVNKANGAVEYDLVKRIAAGDEIAEREFVQRYLQGVRTLVRRYSRPGDPIVEDLTQDVLANVLVRLRTGALRDSKALSSYVHSAVARATSAEYRRRHVPEPEVALEQIAAEDTPLKQVSNNQLKHILLEMLSELPVPRDREILKRFYLDEMDKDEVCRQLGIDADHFHRVVFRARGRLRSLLMEAGFGQL